MAIPILCLISAANSLAASYPPIRVGDFGFALTGNATFDPVPEPSALTLLAIGVVAMLRRRFTSAP